MKTGVILFMAAMLLAGCSGKSSKTETEAEPEQALYPVTIDGKEILVGQTTVQTLLDEGMNVKVSEMTARCV